MANFEYIARTAGGEKITGVLEAATEAAALRALDDQRLFPVRVAPHEKADQLASGIRIRTRDLSQFFEQLSDLLRAGVPLLRALETLGRTNTSPKMIEVVKQIREQISAGKALEEAMALQPTVFRPLQVAMVRAGERGGFLEQVLADLGIYLERQDQLRSRIIGYLIYPVVIALVGMLAVGFILKWLVPKFKPIFEGMDLPVPSKVLFAASDLVAVYWPMTLLGVVMAAIGLSLYMKTESGARVWSTFQLKIPIVGNALRMVGITRFCRILGTLINAGVPLLQALGISRDAAGLPMLSQSIDEAAESVRHGKGLMPPLRECGLFPAQLLEMIAVAEESNQLEKTLLKIADTVERRTNQQVESVVKLIEPVILVVLSAIILFVAIGLLYPIFSMSSSLR